MNPFFDIAFRYGLPLLVIYLSYRYIWKDALLNISFKGWDDLAARYRVDTLPVPGSTITMRIGSQTYNFNNMSFALAAQACTCSGSSSALQRRFTFPMPILNYQNGRE